MSSDYNQPHSYQNMGPSDTRVQIAEQQKPAPDQETNYNCCSLVLIFLSYFLIIITFPVTIFFCIRIVQEYERAVIYRLGRLMGGKGFGPGMFFMIPCTDTITVIDLRTVCLNLPRQEILSKDSVSVAVDAVVYFKVDDPVASVNNILDAKASTKLLAETTLRNVLGVHTLTEILGQRESLTRQTRAIVDEATHSWGIKVERVEIKDVLLPQTMQRSMAAEAESAREARAKVIAAEGEQQASRALKEAADVINESPAALQLRYLQTLNTISAEKNSTIVFPIPIEMFKGFSNNAAAS
ncbi:stomatin-4-like [Convolutriloba macropyga]|uniref:stomatin-4-like n=1 Tax=Convolutriloba macropyga TaxID=536237 RepID=UPI003F51D853